MSQDRYNHCSSTTRGKRSHACLRAVVRVFKGGLATLALVANVGPWTPSAQAASLDWAYLWADRPLAAAYTPTLAWQFNSSGATNTVLRTATGVYTAELPNLGSTGGHVQVTAYGTGSERCKVISWGPRPLSSSMYVDVRCFTSTGTPVDTRFTMTYVAHNNLIGGASYCGSAPGPTGAYAWADQPTLPSYMPSRQWNDFNSGTATITRSGVGAYAVQFTGQCSPSLNSGDVQVTASGPGSEYCKVASWTPGVGVQVRCFNSNGNPVDTRFNVTFLDWWNGR